MNYPVIPCLSAVANEYGNCETGFVADCLLPQVKVKGDQFVSRIGNKLDAFKVTDDNYTCATNLKDVGTFGSLTQALQLEGHGLRYPMPNCNIVECCDDTNYNAEASALKYLIGKVKLKRELDVFNLLTAPSTYPVANFITLAGAAQFNLSTSNALQTIQQYMNSVFPMPNTLVIGQDVADALSRHPQIVGSFSGIGGGMVGNSQLEIILKGYFPSLTTVCIANSRIDTAGTGLPATLVRPFAKQLIMLHNNLDFNSTECPAASFGYTAVREEGIQVKRVPELLNMGFDGGYYLMVSAKRKEVILDNALGLIINNAVA